MTPSALEQGDSPALPRLLYVGDVAVADTFAGAALLFRLLQGYPADKLCVVCDVQPEAPRLPGVSYHHWGDAFPRLLHSRVAEAYCLFRAWRYYRVPRPIARIATRFRPDAILSSSHVGGWLGGWQLAVTLGIPFHLVAHDDQVYANRFPEWARAWATRRFGEAYRAAATRFCISDTMAEQYAERFGAPGVVIYPTSRPGPARQHEVSPRVFRAGGALTFAYGGSINSESDLRQIVTFAGIAGRRGHRLLAYTPQHEQLAAAAGEALAFMDVRRPIPSADLLTEFRERADCLLLPQSLDPADRRMVATAFPSKWADYASLGLPVIVWAPPGSSSARFVHEHPGCAELVTSADGQTVDASIGRLEGSTNHRRMLAETLLRVGRESFSLEAAWPRFCSALTARQQAKPAR